jgi:MerR family mercuric resistance operon transcriptional regulator
MTIGKLAAAGGVGVETVRFYQRRGLLAEPERAGGIRRYGPDDVRRLRFIRSAQTAGFTLEEIRELLALDAGHDHQRARQLARKRIEALTIKIAEMSAARTSLERLARQCCVAGGKPCPIISAFEG